MIIALFAAALAPTGALAGQAADGQGALVVAKAVVQTGTGSANRDGVNLGSVGGSASVEGQMGSLVVVNTIYQENAGTGNRSVLNLGSVTANDRDRDVGLPRSRTVQDSDRRERRSRGAREI